MYHAPSSRHVENGQTHLCIHKDDGDLDLYNEFLEYTTCISL